MLRAGVVDRPAKGKIHQKPVPSAGGLALIFSWSVVSLVAMSFTVSSTKFLIGGAIIAGGLTAGLVGFIDDWKGLSPGLKFGGELVAAALLLIVFHSLYEFPLVLSIFLVLLWTLGLMNAVNMIDGLDGLAAGVGAISGLFFATVGALQGEILLVLLSLLIVAVCLGFLPFNFYPAKVFMGDSGSLFLGYVLAALGLVSFKRTITFLDLGIPFLILGFPIWEGTLSIIRRRVKGKEVFASDLSHSYNIFISRGFSYRGVVLFCYFLAAFCGLCGLAIWFLSYKGDLAVIAVAVLVGVGVTWRYELLA